MAEIPTLLTGDIDLHNNGTTRKNMMGVVPALDKTAELKYLIDFATVFIDFFAYLRLAYDLKTANVDMIKKRILRNDGTFQIRSKLL